MRDLGQQANRLARYGWTVRLALPTAQDRPAEAHVVASASCVRPVEFLLTPGGADGADGIDTLQLWARRSHQIWPIGTADDIDHAHELMKSAINAAHASGVWERSANGVKHHG
jgi:hypothetical protein